MRLNFAQRAGWLAHVAKATLQQHHLELVPTLESYIPVDGVVIDVGAHAGQFAKLFARLASLGHVYAFEPSPYALSVLHPAIRWSRLRNVSVIESALSDAPGSCELSTPIKRRGGVGFGLAHLGGADGPRAHVSYTVPVTTLDAFVEARGLKRVDFIKMDIEGWETPALRGAEKTLRRFHPAIMVEVNASHLARSGSRPADIWGLLEGLGYRASFVRSMQAAPHYDIAGDYLWTPAAA